MFWRHGGNIRAFMGYLLLPIYALAGCCYDECCIVAAYSRVSYVRKIDRSL